MRLLQAQKLVQYLRECEDALDWISDKVRFISLFVLNIERLEQTDVVTNTVTIVYQFSLAVVIARKLDMTCKVDMKQYMYKGWI